MRIPFSFIWVWMANFCFCSTNYGKGHSFPVVQLFYLFVHEFISILLHSSVHVALELVSCIYLNDLFERWCKSQAEARIQELCPDLLHGWQGSKHSGHLWESDWKQSHEDRNWLSDLGCLCCTTMQTSPFDYCSFVIKFETRKHSPLFSLSITLAILYLLWLLRNFRIFPSFLWGMSMKFDRSCFKCRLLCVMWTFFPFICVFTSFSV